MAILTKKEQLPLRDQVTAEMLDERGVPWKYDSEYQLKQLEDRPRVQVRSEENHIPPRQVIAFAEAMRNGAQFPAGIVTRDRRTIDSSTRQEAYRRVGIPRAPMFVVQYDWGPSEVAYDPETRHVHAILGNIGVVANEHGQGLTEKEKRRAVMRDLMDGFSVEGVMQDLHLGRGYVSNIYNEVKALQRGAAVGMGERIEKLKSTQLQALSTADIPEDGVWHELADLALDAGLGGKEIRDLVTQIKGHATVAAKMQLLREERLALATQINDREHERSGMNLPLTGALRRVMGFFRKHKNEEHLMVERNVMLRDGHLQQMEECYVILGRYIQAQKDAMAEEVF